MPTELENPPRFHWALVLILTWVTGGLFGAVWLIVQANWARKMGSGSMVWWLAIANTVVVATSVLCDLPNWMGWHGGAFCEYVSGLVFVFWIAAVYTLRYELVREPIGIVWLSPYLPLILGPVYFQYRLQDYAPAVDGRRATGSLLGL